MRPVIIVQITISLLLMGAILLQAKGTGLGRAFGNEGSFYHTKRGMEKVLLIATVVLALLFFTLAILNFLI